MGLVGGLFGGLTGFTAGAIAAIPLGENTPYPAGPVGSILLGAPVGLAGWYVGDRLGDRASNGFRAMITFADIGEAGSGGLSAQPLRGARGGPF